MPAGIAAGGVGASPNPVLGGVCIAMEVQMCRAIGCCLGMSVLLLLVACLGFALLMLIGYAYRF